MSGPICHGCARRLAVTSLACSAGRPDPAPGAVVPYSFVGAAAAGAAGVGAVVVGADVCLCVCVILCVCVLGAGAENPIFFHATAVDPVSFKIAVQQMAAVGFEMFIFSFGPWGLVVGLTTPLRLPVARAHRASPLGPGRPAAALGHVSSLHRRPCCTSPSPLSCCYNPRHCCAAAATLRSCCDEATPCCTTAAPPP